MKQKKILFLIQLPPPVHGASLRNKFIAESKMINDAFNIKLVPMRFAKDLQDLEKLNLQKLFRMFLFSFRLVKILLSYRPKLIYFTLSPVGSAFYRDALYVSILKLFNSDLLYHLRVLGVKESAKGFKKLLYKFVFRNASVICLSKTAAIDIKPIHNDKIYIVNDGIEDPVSHYGLHLKEKQNTKTKTILFLSNFYKSKGLFILLEATKILLKKRKDFRVHLVGAETAEVPINHLKKFVLREELQDIIIIKTGKYEKEKYLEYLNADIFAFPTYYPKENFPGVVLEAMACQLPIVSTNFASVPEMIDDGENGLLVETLNPEHLAIKLDILLNDENMRNRLGQAAREKFCKNYREEIYEKNMFICFNDVISNLVI